MPVNNLSQSTNRNRWDMLVGIIVVFLLLYGCTSETPQTYRVGVLVGADTMNLIVAPFEARMTELGYVEGKNIAYDIQRSRGDPAEEKRIAGKFVADKVDLVFVFPGQSARTVKAALQEANIPVVFAMAIIEGNNLVDSVRSPGGNITGVRIPGIEEELKCLEAIIEFSPPIERIMVFYDPNYLTTPPILEALRQAALSSKVALQTVQIPRLQDTQAVLQELEKSGNANMGAIMFMPDSIPLSTEASGLILKFADAHRVPVTGGPVDLVQNGVVLSASSDVEETGGLAASLVDRILKGTPAGSIPVVSPAPHLFLNYKKALELGLTVPQGLLKQASEVIR